MVCVIFPTNENKMKRLLIVLVLLLAGCGETDQLKDGIADQSSWKEIRDEVNSSGTITDEQAVVLSENKLPLLSLDGLTSITDKQADSLSKMKFIDISEACQKLIDKYKKPGHASSAPIVDLDERPVVPRPSLKHGGVA